MPLSVRTGCMSVIRSSCPASVPSEMIVASFAVWNVSTTVNVSPLGPTFTCSPPVISSIFIVEPSARVTIVPAATQCQV